jgi:menaquinone-dependent protoporphyrinogen IX oxidase
MGKKGLIVYNSIYSSTSEVAYWLKALLGDDQHVEVKHLDQVISVKPYDYVIIGSYTRWEKPSKATYAFVQKHADDLAQKEVAYFLTCGDTDETQVLKVPGQQAHLIAGRNYLLDIIDKFPAIKPVAIAWFGGRKVMPHLHLADRIQVRLVEKLAKEGTPFSGLDIWESLVPERVEAFANEICNKILGLKAVADVQRYRIFWNSLQPANMNDPGKIKYSPKPYNEHQSTARIYFTRSRIRGGLETAVSLLAAWAKDAGLNLQEQKKSFFNVYYHAVKKYNGTDITTHVAAATLQEDPGNVHIAFRCYDKPDARKGAEEDIAKAEKLLWAEGRKVE